MTPDARIVLVRNIQSLKKVEFDCVLQRKNNRKINWMDFFNSIQFIHFAL